MAEQNLKDLLQRNLEGCVLQVEVSKRYVFSENGILSMPDPEELRKYWHEADDLFKIHIFVLKKTSLGYDAIILEAFKSEGLRLIGDGYDGHIKASDCLRLFSTSDYEFRFDGFYLEYVSEKLSEKEDDFSIKIRDKISPDSIDYFYARLSKNIKTRKYIHDEKAEKKYLQLEDNELKKTALLRKIKCNAINQWLFFGYCIFCLMLYGMSGNSLNIFAKFILLYWGGYHLVSFQILASTEEKLISIQSRIEEDREYLFGTWAKYDFRPLDNPFGIRETIQKLILKNHDQKLINVIIDPETFSVIEGDPAYHNLPVIECAIQGNRVTLNLFTHCYRNLSDRTTFGRLIKTQEFKTKEFLKN